MTSDSTTGEEFPYLYRCRFLQSVQPMSDRKCDKIMLGWDLQTTDLQSINIKIGILHLKGKSPYASNEVELHNGLIYAYRCGSPFVQNESSVKREHRPLLLRIGNTEAPIPQFIRLRKAKWRKTICPPNALHGRVTVAWICSMGFPQFHGHFAKHIVDFQIVPG
jgi:hypothetical protein